MKSRFVTGAFWSVGGTMISRGLTVASSIVAARILGVEGFGELGMVQSTAATFGTLAGCGLALTATKHVAEFRAADPFKAGRIIGLCYLIALVTGAMAAAIILIFARGLAAGTLAAPHLAGQLQFAAGMAFLAAITGVQTGILAGFEAFKSVARISILTGVLAFPMLVGGVAVWGLSGAVIALTCNLGLSAWLYHRAITDAARSHQVAIGFAGAGQETAVLGRFTFFAMLGGLMGVPLNWVGNTLLVHQPGGYEQMGIFSAANQWRMMILFLPATIGGVALPMMTRLHSAGDHRRYRKLLLSTAALNGGASAALALPLMMLAPVVLAFYGPEFVAGKLTFVLLLAASIIIAVNNGLSRAIASVGAMHVDFGMHVAWGASFVTAGYVLIPRFGVTGLAAATLVGAVVQGICQWGWLLRWQARREGVFHQDVVSAS